MITDRCQHHALIDFFLYRFILMLCAILIIHQRTYTHREALLQEEREILQKQKESTSSKLDVRLAEVYKQMTDLEMDKAGECDD